MIAFSTNTAGGIGRSQAKKTKINLYLNMTSYTKINLKWIMGMNLKFKTVKLQENHWGNFLGLRDS